MNANNGWPGKPGVPSNSEKDGWHWLKRISNGWETLAKWDNDWNGNDDFWWNLPGYSDPERVAKSFYYLGPVLTPDETTALQKRVAELEGALRMAAECIDADDTIAARGFLSDALIKKYKPKWVCPNNTPGCVKNCGNYGCGN